MILTSKRFTRYLNYGDQSCLPESWLKDVLVEREESACDDDIGEGDAFTDQVGLVEEMVVQCLRKDENS